MNKKTELRVRHWVFVDDQKFFGPGRAELLERIQRTGSIMKAAKEMGMSYKKAWAMVDDMNIHGSAPYVITHKGGQQGGGTEVTDESVIGYSNQSGVNNIFDKNYSLVEGFPEAGRNYFVNLTFQF